MSAQAQRHFGQGASIPLIANDLLEAVDHAGVCISAGGPSSLQLSTWLSVGSLRARIASIAHTLVLTTSKGYLQAVSVSNGQARDHDQGRLT